MVTDRRTIIAAAWAFALAPVIPLATSASSRPVVIVAEGDSLTYGQDTTSARTIPPINGATATRSPKSYPEMLQRLLGPSFRVINHGFPGDRTIEGLSRWAANPRADIVVLMYGTNDCLNYGGYAGPGGGTVAVADYARNLHALIARRMARGAKVVVVAPPPLADMVADRKLQSYRDAAQRVARATGSPFHVMSRYDGMWSDGVHLSAAGYERLAYGVRPLVARMVPGRQRSK